MADDSTIKNGNEGSPFEMLPEGPDVRQPVGAHLNPIIIDDDSDNDKPQKGGNPAREERQCASHKRRRLSPSTDDGDNAFTPPPKFSELLRFTEVSLHGLADEEVIRLNNKIAVLQAENMKLESAKSENIRITDEKMTALSITLDATMKSAQKLEVFKTKFEEVKLENDKLKEKLELQIAEAEKTRESLQRELTTQTQLVKAQETDIAETGKKLRNSENQASLAGENLRKAREGRALLEERCRKDKLTISTLESDYKKVTSELEKCRQDCDSLLPVKSELTSTTIKLSAASDALEKSEAVRSELESQVDKLEKVKADLESRLAAQQKEHEEARGTLKSQIIEIEHDKATLEDKLHTTHEKAEENSKALQSNLKTTRKALEVMRRGKDNVEYQMKKTVEERAVLSGRIDVLEAKSLEDTYARNKSRERHVAELAVARQEAFRIESELQKQIEYMKDHMSQCPMAYKPKEFMDNLRSAVDQSLEAIEKERIYRENALASIKYAEGAQYLLSPNRK